MLYLNLYTERSQYMFIRKRSKPRTLQKIDALIPRLPQNHPQIPSLKKHAAKLQKGYNGERRLDYYLQSLPNEFYVLSDVGLTIHKKDFQMDSLIVSPHAIYMIETKNLEGILTFDTTHRQLIQSNNQKNKSYTFPITQAENTSFLMMQWLLKHGFNGIPIHIFVAIAQPNTIIRVNGDEEIIEKYVIQAEEAALRIINIEDKYRKTVGNHQRRNKITSKVMEYVKDFEVDIYGKYNIDPLEILPGTRCVECGHIGMDFHRGIWSCKKCNISTKNAHITSINDFQLLFKKEMRVKEAMHFLGLPNRYTTYRILKKSNVIYQHNTKMWISTY